MTDPDVEHSKRYTLQEAGNTWLRILFRRRLVRDGEALPVLTNGDAIDLQIALGACTILAISYDYFEGCKHWIYLLREDGRLIDQLRMPDQFGFIEHAHILSEHEISFSYFGANDMWRLSVNKNGFWSFSLKALVARPNRFLLGKRHLTAYRTEGLKIP